MKKHLIYTALLATAPLLLNSCFEDEPAETAAPEKASETAAAEQEQTPVAPACPTDEEIATLLTEQLPVEEALERGDFSCEPPQQREDGTLALTVHQSYSVKENLYARENAPESFNEQRKGINDAVNAATQPESVYILQVGGTTEMLTDADRIAKPLPEDLQAKANELKDLSESTAWQQAKAAGDQTNVTIRFTARYEEGAWHYDGITVDDTELQPLRDLKPESRLTEEGAFLLSPENIAARTSEIAEKIDAFNAAAAPYIAGREDAARKTLTEQQAAAEEAAHRAAEQAAAEEATRRQWVSTCAAAIANGKDFSGEWTRDSRFGELTLHIEQAKSFDTSIQFIGSLYDTKLPEASLDIAGRCDLAPSEEGAQVDITIYDGRYDPDQPTADVYDARDGLLKLRLGKDGKLEGIMTCAAWSDTPEKAFKITLSPKAEAAKENKGNNRRRR